MGKDVKELKFVKIRCEGGHLSLIPKYEVFHVYEPIRCEKCGKAIVEAKEKNRSVKKNDYKQN